jgi:hypothetical protein
VQEDSKTIVVADGSGSMTCTIGGTSVTALTVANALAVYFAEKLTGEFKDKYITFSANPRLVDFTSCASLKEKIELAYRYNEVANTDIEAVFNLILTTAQRTNMKQEDLPANILILSDMEFDYAVSDDMRTVVHRRLLESPEEAVIGKKIRVVVTRRTRLPLDRSKVEKQTRRELLDKLVFVDEDLDMGARGKVGRKLYKSLKDKTQPVYVPKISDRGLGTVLPIRYEEEVYEEYYEEIRESKGQKLFDGIKQKYEQAGYKLPRLIFWNLNSRTGTIPVIENDLGVALVSGFSVNIVRMVLNSELDPYKCLIEQLTSARYAKIILPTIN